VTSPPFAVSARSAPPGLLAAFARTLDLGSLLAEITARYGGYDLVAHWTQGEFHHDVTLRLPEAAQADLPGRVLVVATNCNGGVKEVLCFAAPPDRSALWHHRCPDVADFAGALEPILARSVTEHWFDPCELLGADARSELRPEYRRQQRGGGWEQVSTEPSACGAPASVRTVRIAPPGAPE
jgi:hypothetical protein